MLKKCFWSLLLALFIFSGAAAAQVYYVSPTGDDGAAGTQLAPWRSLAYVCAQVQPGDTVILLPGVYRETLRPRRSGTADAPITFRSHVRREAIFIGSGERYPIDIEGQSHIVLSGLVMQPHERQGGWVRLAKASHIVIEDFLMEEAATSRPFAIDYCEQIQVLNSDIRKQGYGAGGGNLITIQNSHGLLFAGNAFSRGAHDLVLVYPDRTNSNVVFRGNVFQGAWTRSILIDGVYNTLFEDNIIVDSYDGARNAGSNYQFYATEGIFRFNRIFNNWGVSGLTVAPYRDTLDFQHVRFYHNDFYDNATPAVNIQARSTTDSLLSDAIFTNNLFWGNDRHGDDRQIEIKSTTVRGRSLLSEIQFDHNAILGRISHAGINLSVEQAQTKLWADLLGVRFRDNLDLAAIEMDVAVQSGGRFLTHTGAAGAGRLLPVDDVRYFYDGFGIAGEQGDLISVGTAGNVARVVKRDVEANLLHLDRDIGWQADDGVSLAWSKAETPIGTAGDAHVKIGASASRLAAGEALQLQAEIAPHLQPVAVTWHLGDGSRAAGEQVTHSYAHPADYPIRLEVLAADGQLWRASHYVAVTAADETVPAVLFHSTFADDDEEWWWRWQAYRPEPTAWALVAEGRDGASLHIYAPEEGTLLPARIHPAGWDVDQYPRVRVVYRVTPGTPVGLYLDAFPTAKRERRVWVAVSDVCLGHSALLPGTPLLVADGEWHELEFDARLLREVYPEVNVLQTLGWEALNQGLVRSNVDGEPHGYWIDEVEVRAGDGSEYDPASWLVEREAVVEPWELLDELLPPQQWGMFGMLDRSQTVDQSAGWLYATEDAEDFFADADRLRRGQPTTEYLTWQAPQLRECQVTLYARNPEEAEHVRLFISADGQEFQALSYDVEEEVSTSGWYRILFTAQIEVGQESQFFKLEMGPLPAAVEELQLGRVYLWGDKE